MLCTIVTVGLVLLFLDFTFIQLLAIVIAVGIILPFLLGMITPGEVREALDTFKEQKLKKISFLKKLDEIKFFEKPGSARPAVPSPKIPAKPDTASPQPKKPEASGGSKLPFHTQITSIVTSLKSLGTIIQERTRRERKVTDINKMLDSAVSEKVEKNAAPAGSGAPTLPAPGGAGSGSSAETDPFLSLSGDEFDAGLLDGLDDMDMSPSTGSAAPASGADQSAGTPDMSLPEPELSMPDMDLDSAAGDILKENAAEGLDEFSGLEPGEESDTDLADLDNLSLDDVDLDADLDDAEESGGSGTPTSASPDATAPAAAAGAAPAEQSSAVKTTWIPSDAPKGADQMEDQIGTQSDMAAFASSSGGSDEDLLSSIASDVKHVTKEKDLSLLRELKDFKAPADQIEKELTDMFTRLSGVQKKKEVTDSATNEKK